jgi:hypothetical protein
MLYEKIRDAFVGGVYTDELQDPDNGGPECANYMTFEYRLTVTLICVRKYIFIINYFNIFPT